MSDFPKFVQINEEGPREGFQFEKGPIATDRKVELIDALSETGLNHIQVASFVNPNGPRVLATGNEVTHRAHSGNPAFRRPSISSFAFDCPPRAIHADIVKAGSTSSRRAAASRASASRPRWAKADARQR